MPIVVVKLGGEILRQPKAFNQAIDWMAKVKKRNSKTQFILVHGAGPQLDKRFKEKGIPVNKIDGKRVSTKKRMDVAWNFIPEESATVAKKLSQSGFKAESIDYSLTTLARIGNKKLGFVGIPIGVDVKNLKRVLKKGVTPIVSIFGVTKQKHIVNVNADEVASGIAIAMKADLLELKTNTAGVLSNGKTIGRISVRTANRLLKEKIARDGMRVKLRAAKTAVEGGARQARIVGLGPNKKGTTIRRNRK